MRKTALALLLLTTSAFAQAGSSFTGPAWYYITGDRILGGPYASLADCRSHAANGGACTYLEKDPGGGSSRQSTGTPG